MLRKKNKPFSVSRQILFTSLLFLFIGNNKGYGQPVTYWHGIPRELRYHPEGGDFVIHNGNRRFNRALYGTNTAFRVEAGDLPEFALYLPGMGGNLKFGLINGCKSKWLINASSIEARYRPGSMIYVVKDTLLGKGSLVIQVLAGATSESLIVKMRLKNISPRVKLFWAYGGANGKKFSRDGDIGADPESSFYLQPDYCKGNTYKIDKTSFSLAFNGKSISEAGRYEIDQTGKGVNKGEVVTTNTIYGAFPNSKQLHLADAGLQGSPSQMLESVAGDKPAIVGVLENNKTGALYWALQNNQPIVNSCVPKLFNEAEAKRRQLASRVQVKTPDPYINTLGGALSIAADGIWESPSYLHGAVAWRMRLNAWRGPYVADPLGWHDRAWSHFSSYALSQITSPDEGPVVADTALHLARQQEKLGTAMFSSGYISRNPGGDIRPHHYDMNLVYIDALLNHFKWTGNLDEVKKMWPVLKRHLAWEKRNFDADGDGLYDAYCAIWASDALQYSGGGVTHSSAYNYRANKLAADIAARIGEDPAPYRGEAAKILDAINKSLWMPGTGSYAEYKDLLGLQLLHPSAGLWTIYHTIDSNVPDAFQAYQALRYIDTQIPHIPVLAKGLSGNYYLPSTTNWLPYDWSLNNVVMAESLHTSLAYWQANRKDDAFVLWKSALLESMYLGASPGNFQQISFYDAHRGELYRDFADPIGMAARSLVEGLFGIRPDALSDTLTIKPGLPSDWKFASLVVPDIKFNFQRNDNIDSYTIRPSFQKSMNLRFEVNAMAASVSQITVNGRSAKWVYLYNAVGSPVLQITAGKLPVYKIKIVWQGAKPEVSLPGELLPSGSSFTHKFKIATPLRIFDPQQVLTNPTIAGNLVSGSVNTVFGDHTIFVKLKQGLCTWWQPLNLKIVKPLEVLAAINQKDSTLRFKIKNNSPTPDISLIVNPELKNPYSKNLTLSPGNTSDDVMVSSQYLLPGSNHIRLKNGETVIDTNIINWKVTALAKTKFETVDLTSYFNDKLTNIFKNKYLSPRPKSPTLQLPWQGIGNWAYPLITANIDDSGLKKAAGKKHIFELPQHIPLATSNEDDNNIVFTSQWDNYPRGSMVPVTGRASHVYLLMAGSTNPMQSRITNAEIIVTYQDGSQTCLPIKNPENWWPIEQDDDNDGYAFNTGAARPLRIYLKSGIAPLSFDNYTTIKGYSNKAIDGGAATVLDMPLDTTKQLKSLQLKTLANDVVIGLMSITLVRE